MSTPILIRPAGPADHDATLAVERLAFGQPDEADLTAALLADPTAAPVLSLLAWEGSRAVGHALFSNATLPGADCRLLAPLAVLPDRQGRGIGRALIEEGCARLRAEGVGWVFVFGDPAFYGRFGFAPALPRGLAPPYPLPDWLADAWQVHELTPDRPGPDAGNTTGQVGCAAALRRPEYWTI